MLVARLRKMRNIVLGRISKFNYKKFKSTFLILSFLFSIIGCGIESIGSTPSSSAGNESTGSTPSSSADDENISDSVNADLDNSVNLSWAAPTTNADGTKLSDLGGYIVYYGEQTSTNYAYAIDVGNKTFITINDLSSGTWCFALTSYDIDGNESDYSFEACKDI
jgi:hypothetical protein